MSDKVPLHEQINAGIAAFAMAVEKGLPVNEVAVRALIRTLQWMDRHPDALRTAAELVADEGYRKLKATFPEAHIAGARRT